MTGIKIRALRAADNALMGDVAWLDGYPDQAIANWEAAGFLYGIAMHEVDRVHAADGRWKWR